MITKVNVLSKRIVANRVRLAFRSGNSLSFAEYREFIEYLESNIFSIYLLKRSTLCLCDDRCNQTNPDSCPAGFE